MEADLRELQMAEVACLYELIEPDGGYMQIQDRRLARLYKTEEEYSSEFINPPSR
jgi:hypothetical protein